MRLLIAITLLTATFATSEFLQSHGFNQIQDTLKNVDSSSFGKNLLDTIALQMDSNAPMADIANLIRDMMDDLRKLQQEADNAHSIKQGECNDQVTSYNARMTHATVEVSEATQAIKTLRGRSRQLTKDIQVGEMQVQMISNQEVTGRERRAKDTKDFTARQEQTSLVLQALEVIIPKLKAITPHTAAETFMELAKLGAANPIQALVEVASSLDGEALNRCIGLLEGLQVDFTEFLEDDMEAEIQAQVNFDRSVVEAAAMKKASGEKLAADTIELEEVTMALANQNRRLTENAQELQTASDSLAAKTTECNLYNDNYQRDTDGRNAELEILEQVAQIIASRLSGLQSFIQMRD